MKKFVFAAICLLGLNLFCSCEKEPVLTVDPPELLLFDNNGGSQTLCITTNREWYISSSESWCKVSQESGKASETTSFNVTITCDANTSYDDRTSTIMVYAESMTQKIVVRQRMTEALFVEQTEYTVPGEEQTLEIKVSSNISYEVFFDDSCKDWISLAETKSFSEKVIALKIEKNEGPERTGKIRISDGTLYEDISITQIPLVFVEFEDANFKDYCVKNFDKNGDGEISTSEATAITEIRINTSNIGSLVGIEYFINLTDLVCELDWASAEITTIGDLITIRYFDNQDNEITSKLRSLDISKNTKIRLLQCRYNQLSSLDVSNNLELAYLLCSYNQLEELNLRHPNLEILVCDYNKLSSLDISNCCSLVELSCGYNPLTKLNVGNQPDLSNLNCKNSQLSSLDVSSCPALSELYCEKNRLSSLDISRNSALETLSCSDNQLSSLDVSNCPTLAKLYCEKNRLSSLDVSRNSALETLSCSDNQLTCLDISQNSTLKNLSCDANQLSSLDVNKNSALEYLMCSDNQLTCLDISQNSALKNLLCDANQLRSLDMSKNSALETLSCSDNQLTCLDLSNNLALYLVACNFNPYLKEIWLKQGQTFSLFFDYDKDIATIKYKE